MKKILFRSAFLVALTGFSAVLLSAAHSHTMDKAWVELKAKQTPFQAIQDTGLGPATAPAPALPAPALIVAEVWPVAKTSLAPLRPKPQMAERLIVGDLQLTTSLRPKMRPRIFLTSGGLAPAAVSSGQPVQSSWQPVARPAKTSGHVARNSGLSAGFDAPAQGKLQRWLADRPVYDLGTQVGVFR
ncbi:MAG: hypothetical protein HRU33_02145 [Rhodobacteraceae bacterium]|nr:hypothetical protein [Paracoccaceae bacterium]